MWDPAWETIFNEKSWGKYPGEDVIRFIARNYFSVQDRKRVRILEIGSGAGANLSFLARERFNFSAVEGSISAVNQSIEFLDVDMPNWRKNGSSVQVGDCVNLPFVDDTFDAVLDVGAISCNSFEDSKRIYTELYRVSKLGGKLFSRVLAGGCWGDGTGSPAGRRAYINCTEGPVADLGFIRFTDESDVDKLLGPWNCANIERLNWTEENRAKEIRHLLIFGEK